MPKSILVTGATGNVGLHLTELLLAVGAQVRALCRDPAKVSLLPRGALPVAGDLTDAESLVSALGGVSRAFVILAEDGGAAFSEAVRSCPGLEHLVVLSANAPGGRDMANPLFRKHVMGEARLASTGLPVTVLRPGPFASLALQWAPSIRQRGVVGAAHPEVALPVIDPRDIAEVAATILLGPPGSGVLGLSGPQMLDTYDRARILGDVLGRQVRVQHLTEEQWIAAVAVRLPEAYARALLGVERYLAELRPPVVATVQEVTAHPARSFRSWAEANAPAFAG